jgi:hypothetical protein
MTSLCGPTPLSPELALVCPELREAAIAALPERDPEGRLAQRPRDPAYLLMRSIDAEPQAPVDESRVGSLPLAVVAYTMFSATRVALEAVAVLGAVIGFLSVVAVIHS